jgi:hypothetical protein
MSSFTVNLHKPQQKIAFLQLPTLHNKHENIYGKKKVRVPEQTAVVLTGPVAAVACLLTNLQISD